MKTQKNPGIFNRYRDFFLAKVHEVDTILQESAMQQQIFKKQLYYFAYYMDAEYATSEPLFVTHTSKTSDASFR